MPEYQVRVTFTQTIEAEDEEDALSLVSDSLEGAAVGFMPDGMEVDSVVIPVVSNHA